MLRGPLSLVCSGGFSFGTLSLRSTYMCPYRRYRYSAYPRLTIILELLTFYWHRPYLRLAPLCLP